VTKIERNGSILWVATPPKVESTYISQYVEYDFNNLLHRGYNDELTKNKIGRIMAEKSRKKRLSEISAW